MSTAIIKSSSHFNGFLGVGGGGLTFVSFAERPTIAVAVAVLKEKVPLANAAVAVARGIPHAS
jgi:hypothetical protein